MTIVLINRDPMDISLNSLYDDAILAIMKYLDIKSLLSLLKTCQRHRRLVTTLKSQDTLIFPAIHGDATCKGQLLNGIPYGLWTPLKGTVSVYVRDTAIEYQHLDGWTDIDYSSIKVIESPAIINTSLEDADSPKTRPKKVVITKKDTRSVMYPGTGGHTYDGRNVLYTASRNGIWLQTHYDDGSVFYWGPRNTLEESIVRIRIDNTQFVVHSDQNGTIVYLVDEPIAVIDGESVYISNTASRGGSFLTEEHQRPFGTYLIRANYRMGLQYYLMHRTTLQ